MVKKDGDPPTGPQYVEQKLPRQFKASSSDELPKINEQWWQDFGSDELNSLVETSLSNNFDLRIAIARVAQARAQATVAKAAEYPTLDANVRYGNQAPTPGPGYAADMSTWSSQPLWQIGGLVGYEVDLWGKRGFDTDSAYALALASEFNRQAVALSLVGDVVSTYIQIIALNERISVGERNLDAIKLVGKGLERRVNLGDSTLIDLSQQLILQRNTDAQVSTLRLQKEKTQNRLASLLGIAPSSLTNFFKKIDDIRTPLVHPGLPSDLLCRRPDIRKAEAELESAQADLYAARASLFPKFAITGAGGYGSFLLTQLAMPQSLFYNITSSLVQNIFDAEKRQSQIQAASAKNIELLENYANTVINALRDVEGSLSGVVLTAKQYTELNEARILAKRLAMLSEKVLERGGMDYLQLYEIQKTVLAAEDSAITAKSDQLIASVSLIKSLGGSANFITEPCQSGQTSKANADWAARANNADSVFETKRDLTIMPNGQMGYRGGEEPVSGYGSRSLSSPVGGYDVKEALDKAKGTQE